MASTRANNGIVNRIAREDNTVELLEDFLTLLLHENYVDFSLKQLSMLH